MNVPNVFSIRHVYLKYFIPWFDKFEKSMVFIVENNLYQKN